MILLKIQKWVDRVAVVVSSVLCAALMVVLLANVILRYIPGIGGFSWYMEGSQYLNVWSMFIVGVGLCVRGDHLRVNIVEDLCAKNRISHAVQQTVVSFLMAVFYGLVTYAFSLLVTKGMKVRISTMQSFRMGQVYIVIPVATGLSAAAYLLDWIINLLGLKEKAQEVQKA